MKKSAIINVGLVLAAVASCSLSASGAYKRGDLIWKCDFTRSDLQRINGTNSYLREGSSWIANEGKDGDGAMVAKNKTEKNTFMFGVPLNVPDFVGLIQIEADVKGVDLRPGPQPFNGPKIMFPYKANGRTSYPQLPSEYGSFDWKTWCRVDCIPPETTSLTLVLGLEQAPGEFYIDAIRIYRAVEIPDSEVVAPKNPRADALPRGKWQNAGRPGARRGVMSGNDLSRGAFRTLYDWNANLIRMQIGIGTKNLDSMEDWFAELDRRLVEVDRVLALCREFGLKMVIDLHGGPGCKATKHASNVVPADYDTTCLKRAWRTIARRYCEDPSIYGYDILNEPACAPETWDRVFREVTAEIRTVDRKTPVITETVKYWYHNENVIYSPHYYSPHTLTHFGVGGDKGVRWSYNNWINGEFWNKDRIREELAPFIRFQIAHPDARIYIGEFSCILWSRGADGYINDCVELFDEYGWDWTYHAFREWPPWSVEEEPSADCKVGYFTKAKGETKRLQALKKGFAKNARGAEELLKPVRKLPQPNLTWIPPPHGTIKDGMLEIARPAAGKDFKVSGDRGLGYAKAFFDCSQYAGHVFRITAKCLSAEPVGNEDNQIKFMFHYKNAAANNEPKWVEIPHKELADSKGGCELQIVVNMNAATLKDKAMLGVGLFNERGGKVKIDLNSLRFETIPDVHPWRNVKWQCNYPERVKNMPQLRGVMLANEPTEKDFADLHAFGATLVRYQMNPDSRVKDNATEEERIAFYDRWLAKRLDHLERNVLGWGRKYGIRIVVDSHGSCGGRGAGGEVAMYHNPRYAARFVDAWEAIGKRFAGNEDVIYGYDIFNEPVMNQSPAEGCDYWTLQKRCAEAIRRHDKKTSIIVECSNWDCPNGFETLSPLAMDNVIYQVHCYNPHEFTHQFVHANSTTPIAYPFTRKNGARVDKEWQRRTIQPVIDFQKKHKAKIFVGEFSAICWAEGADRYLADLISLFKEYNWDWTYHAFREWHGWSVEHEPVGGPGTNKFKPSADNPRRRALLKGFRGE